MIWFLRTAFSFVFITMVCVAFWASGKVALWNTPQSVLGHPWFIATLFDCYFGFLTFFTWLAYKETNWFSRIAWLLAIIVLGNIAMSGYMLLLLFRLPATATIEQVLLRQKQ